MKKKTATARGVATTRDTDNESVHVVQDNEPVEGQEDEGLRGPIRPSTRELEYLNRVLRFLLMVQTPAYARRVRREGYTPEEHRIGLELWQKASGLTRPLDDFFAREQNPSWKERDDERRILQDVDTFENTWFPRTHAIIRRVVAKDRRDAFEQAFFADLTQQPLGPEVVGSVTTFLARVEGLEKSTQPEAKTVRQTLAARGLTSGRIKSVRALIEELGKLEPTEAPVDLASLRKADQAQQDALGRLHDWFTDWTTTFRSVFTASDQIRLGITLQRRGGKRGDDQPNSEEDANEDSEANGDSKADAG